MDPDIGQIRAFLAVADEGHFGRAAESLHLTQQAVSRRVAVLEATHGPLLDRGPYGVGLTPAGRELLPTARALLAAADRMPGGRPPVDAGPLRVDVWMPFTRAEAIVREFGGAHPDQPVSMSRRGDLGAALDALRRREIDAALGYVGGLPTPLDRELESRLVRLARVNAIVDLAGPLADVEVIDRERLRRTGLIAIRQASGPEVESFVGEYAEDMGTRLVQQTGAAEVGTQLVPMGPDTATLVDSSFQVPPGLGLASKPLEPTPLYPWEVVWRRDDPHPGLQPLLAALTAEPLESDAPAEDVWLPAALRGRPVPSWT